MNLFRKTILILILILPIFVYARAEMQAESEEVEDVLETDQISSVVVLEDVVSQDPVKAEIQKVFGNQWKLAYAVMYSESSGTVKATNQNTDSHRSIDRGLFQINSYWHPEVSVECAFDMKCNIKEAYRISKGGTDWRQWYGFLNGNYKKYL
jgi:hypothetical protein